MEPRIRGDNPPLTTALTYRKLTRDNTFYHYGFIVAAVLVGVLFFLCFLTGWNPFVAVPLVILLFLAALFGFGQNSTARQLDVTPPIVPLYAYNTNFLAPLADGSRLTITIHFQLPAAHQAVMDQYRMTETPSPCMEQLNRVTENLLIPFVFQLTKPPSPGDVEEHLHVNLVRFQNECNLPVLRVNVPLILHSPAVPPKKSVHV